MARNRPAGGARKRGFRARCSGGVPPPHNCETRGRRPKASAKTTMWSSDASVPSTRPPCADRPPPPGAAPRPRRKRRAQQHPLHQIDTPQPQAYALPVFTTTQASLQFVRKDFAMKNLLRSALAGLLLVTCASCRGQNMVRIGFDVADNRPKYTIQSKVVSPERLVDVLKKLSKLSDSQTLVVVPTARVSVSDLLGLLLTIRESGLHRIIISAPANRNGSEGRITIALDIFRESFYGDVGGGYTGGFETNSTEFMELFVKPEELKQK